MMYSPGEGGRASTSLPSPRIFDRFGRLVAKPKPHAPHVAPHRSRWDLTSADGRPAVPGVYRLRLEADTPHGGDVKRLTVVEYGPLSEAREILSSGREYSVRRRRGGVVLFVAENCAMHCIHGRRSG